MKKHSFYTMRKDSEKKRISAVLVDGFYDSDTELNYYKADGGTWYSVCPLCGLSVGQGRTKKECVLKTIEMLPAYKNGRCTERFNKWVEQYNEAVKIALMTR